METCVSFLRSVNMAGHNLIKMTELSALIVKLGFADAKTYIQSGNIIYSNHDKLSSLQLSLKIEQAIAEKFGLEIDVMTRTARELDALFIANPFLSEPGFDPAKNAVIFLHENPSPDQVNKVKDIDFPPDKFSISGSEIFLWCPNGFGRTKIYTGFFEKKMNVIGTARNWKTINSISAMIR
jgi:uncharacterized protein (DUF1697 family)